MQRPPKHSVSADRTPRGPVRATYVTHLIADPIGPCVLDSTLQVGLYIVPLSILVLPRRRLRSTLDPQIPNSGPLTGIRSLASLTYVSANMSPFDTRQCIIIQHLHTPRTADASCQQHPRHNHQYSNIRQTPGHLTHALSYWFYTATTRISTHRHHFQSPRLSGVSSSCRNLHKVGNFYGRLCFQVS